MARGIKNSGDENTKPGVPEAWKNKIDSAESVNQPSSGQPCLIVGIGASAGGHAALEQIFTFMPANCGLAFVVIMHFHPDGPSYLPEILGRCTPMPVVTAEHGMTLQPDTIHVIPPGFDLTVAGRRIQLDIAERTRSPHHPIDRLFQSLAADAASRSIAVILSGFGIDGSVGIKAVKEAGGAVLVQEPSSAINSAMPKSAIATGAADYVLPVEEIAAKIAEIARGICVLSHRSCLVVSLDDDLDAIFRVVKLKTGHDFSSYKANTVMRRIERRMAINDVSSIGKYVALIEGNPKEAQALCQDILIGVTSFFRDPEAFEFLQHKVIPRLFEGRDPEDPVRIWHACCATGEEVYSMAILIQEHLQGNGLNAKVQLFATDIDETAISQARAGVYPEDIVQDLGRERLERYFTRTNGHWQVKKQLREMVVFAHHSLIKDPPFSRLDLLVCRNFLIYLNADMQKRLIALFHQVLKNGAVLFLGSAESVGRNSELFTTINNKWKIFERLESKRRMETIFPVATTSVRMPTLFRPARASEAAEPSLGTVAERLLMERYSPPCAVVNDKFEVMHVSTRLGRFLEVPTGEPTRDILRMAREDLRPTLRAAIYKAFAEQKRIEFRGVKVADKEHESTINLVVEPLGQAHGSKHAMVIFEPSVQPAVMANLTGGAGASDTGSSKEMLIHQLEEQLRVTHEQLQATSEQLETSNEGFMSANEELMSINEEYQSANEELQSTNEELETSKEELQALNEELITVNAELQGKVEELNLATSDMENLLTSSEIATLFLDRKLNIKRFTPAMAGIFSLIPADIGRTFRHFAGTIDWSGLARDAEAVLENLVPIEREVTAAEAGRYYLMRVLPYRNLDGGIDGIVVTLIDISEHKRLEERTVHLASFPQLNPNPILEVDLSGKVIFRNPATGKILENLGMDRDDFAVFLPADLDVILKSWDGQNETTRYREINVGDRAYGETIFLTSQFHVARIYAFDITERKRAQEALVESEQRVRLKLESIISPEGDIGNLDLADIIDTQALQSLVDDFYELTRMPMGLLDIKGKVLAGVGWKEICTKFHRVNPETCRNCVESDVQLSAGIPQGEYKIYKCKNNMWDVATPVIVGDRHFGNLFMGQFFFDDEPLDYELFRSQARKYGFDEKEYISALEGVPRLSRETLHTSMSFFMKLADVLSKLSYSNIKLARSLAEREALMGSLRVREEQQRMFIRHAPVALAMFDTDMRYLSVSRRWQSDYGLNGRNLIGESHYDVFPEIVAEWRDAHRRGLAGEVVRAEGDRFDRADGSVQWVRWEVRPWYDVAGEIGGIVIFADDISEIKKAEEILRRYELMAGNSRDIILFMRRDDGHILEANAAAVNAYGYDRDELLEFTVNELRAPESLGMTAAQMAEADTHGILFETVHRRKDGSTFPVEVSSQGANIDGKRTLISVIRDITERKRAEELIQRHFEELRRSRERLDLALASSRMATFDWDIVNKKCTWSDGVHSLLGTKPETFSGSGEEFFQIIHPEDRSTVQAAIERAVEASGIYETEYRAVWPDGSIHHISARGKVQYDDAGQAVLMAGVCWDITERKQGEERLRAQARTLKALNSSNQALLHATDELSLLQAVCRTVAEDCGHVMVWIGFAEEDEEKSVRPVASSGFDEGYLETLGITWADTERGRGPTGTAIRTGKPCGCADMLSDPAFEPWRAEAIKRGYASSLVLPLMSDGKAFGALSIYSPKPYAFSEEEVDMLMQLADELAYGIRTVRLRIAHDQAYEELRHAKEEWERTFNSVPDLIAIIDDRHRVVRVNRAMAERLGREPGECVGMPCYEAVHGANLPPDFCPHSKSMNDCEEHNVELHEERLGGDFLVTTTPLLDSMGRLTGTVHVARDITERKQAEVALKRAYDEMEKRVEERTAELRNKDKILLLQSRQAAMGEMIGNIAHQWRQPLNALGLTIQRQLLFYDLGEFSRESLAKDVGSSMELIHHMSKTIDDFSNYFKPDKDMVEFRVRDALKTALSILEGSLQNPKISVEIAAKDDPVIWGYQNEFAQVLLNIMINARDALIEREIGDPRVTATIFSEDGCAVLTIADNAGGISNEIIGKIFDPYFTTKGPQHGTGVGLFMSKAIIEKNMGGKLSVRNCGNGAEFRIEVSSEVHI